MFFHTLYSTKEGKKFKFSSHFDSWDTSPKVKWSRCNFFFKFQTLMTFSNTLNYNCSKNLNFWDWYFTSRQIFLTTHLNVLLQISHLWFFCPSWTVWMWSLSVDFWAKELLQSSQWWFFIFSWTVSMCFLRFGAWPKVLSQNSHMWLFCPSWTIRMWSLRYFAVEGKKIQI